MNRTTIALTAVSALLAGALGYSLLDRPSPSVSADDVRAIVEEVVTARIAALPAPAAAPAPTETLSAATLNPMIEDYLMSDPKLLQRMATALDAVERVEKQAKSAETIAQYADLIFNAPNQVVVGNPEGDVTLVEFFDYNCGYCRTAMPQMAELIAEDPNLKIILKELPILSNESLEAARVGVLVAESGADYWAFHEALYSGRGKANKDSAIAAARSLGLSPVQLELNMESDSVAETIQNSYKVAQALGISGTPSFIIGNEVIPGAVGKQALQQRIANMRECGNTQCG